MNDTTEELIQRLMVSGLKEHEAEYILATFLEENVEEFQDVQIMKLLFAILEP